MVYFVGYILISSNWALWVSGICLYYVAGKYRFLQFSYFDFPLSELLCMGEGDLILATPYIVFDVVNMHHLLNIRMSGVNGNPYYGDYGHKPYRDSPDRP
jgi:hypothetical protein